MKVINKSDKHVVIFNGTSYSRLTSGEVSKELPNDAAAKALSQFPFLEMHVERKRSKKLAPKGIDKMIENLEV